MVGQPARIPAVNSAYISGVLQPSPSSEPVTEAKNPCKDDHLGYDGDSYYSYYEYESPNDPCTTVATTTEDRNKKTNAVAPIRTKNCRFCRLY